MFERLGFEETSSDALVKGEERVALYATRDERVKHAARQLGSGMWSSKLGNWIDIAHELHAVENAEYGKVATIMKRTIAPALPATGP